MPVYAPILVLSTASLEMILVESVINIDAVYCQGTDGVFYRRSSRI